ncbi:hypothetical protein BJ170DRAFT_686799 [Xylariales sp. AK1849]|nr:hypothetical protein BJ170DRAFT_686799 [Xylariales sp. AK1849]
MGDWERTHGGRRRQSRSPKKDTTPVAVKKSPTPTHGSAVDEDGGRKKTHQRSSTAVRVVDIMRMSEDSLKRSEVGSYGGFESDSSDDGGSDKSAILEASRGPVEARARSMSPSVVSTLTSMTTQTNGSESSSGSGSTVTPTSYARRNSVLRRSPVAQPNAMSFLDSDSPGVTRESIQESMNNGVVPLSPVSSTRSSPTVRSTVSSSPSSFRSDGSLDGVDRDTDQSTSPEGSPARSRASTRPTIISSKKRHRSYGTPDMPRGNANLPHISPDALTPRIPAQVQGYTKHLPKYLPRAEKLPLTGYEQLAAQLAGQGPERSGPYVRPMYRRFEMLNHRLLLHLQDELCELEEQLHRLDTADTQNRRVQNGILPASRRGEALTAGELQWHKTDILGKIGFKMEQYNRVLSSFKATASLPAPTLADVHEYRGYLVTHSPVADVETHFLDVTEDLVCLGTGLDHEDCDEDYDEDTAATPMPRREFNLPSPCTSGLPTRTSSSCAGEDEDVESARPIIPLSLAMAVAVVVPVLTFGVVPGYLDRLMVAFLFGLGILGALIQGQMVVVGVHAARDFCLCAGFYGAVMGVVAGVYR